LVWFIPRDARILDHTHNFHAFDNPSKHNVFVVEEGCCGASDEELAAVCIWAGVLSFFARRLATTSTSVLTINKQLAEGETENIRIKRRNSKPWKIEQLNLPPYSAALDRRASC
jgi:hypothetical protein